MILNGLGFSNRRLYLVPQFFSDKPVETLLGPGITANDLNDECLGRTLDWLYAHDPTALFAGIAMQARRVFGIAARQIHVDTTSFSVSGEYLPEEGDLDASVIAITYGYSRDHRADLKQWMLALGTTQEGDIPLFLRPLNGNSSDQRTLLSAVQALAEQLRTPEGEEERIYIADSGVYSSANMQQLNAAGILWESRVPETLAEAKAALARTDVSWKTTEDGEMAWWSQVITLPRGQERWVIVRTRSGERRARATLQRKVEAAEQIWKQKVWHLSNQRFACEADARTAGEHELRRCPAWFEVETQVVAHPTYAQPGRPRKGATPRATEWQVQVTLAVNQERVEAEALRAACFIVGTNVLDPKRVRDQELVTTYKEQGGVERGFRFLKDPLFLASSVFLKKPERIMALSLIMVL
jgi:transposase